MKISVKNRKIGYTYGSVSKFVGAAADYYNENRGAE